MSVPKSKVLNVSRGVGLHAEFKNNCSKQSVVVNVLSKDDKDKKQDNVEERVVDPIPESNPYENIEEDEQHDVDVKYRNIDELVDDKDRQIKAYELMLELIENNPIIVNKYIIADFNTLVELLHLLTDADEITISENDPDVGCTCSVGIYHYIDKIYITKNGDKRILKYDFPDVIELMDKHRISLKIFYAS